MGRIYTDVVGNIFDEEWKQRLDGADLEFIELDQWTAQKSRFVARSQRGGEYAIALRRSRRLVDGDVLHFDSQRGRAVVVRIKLSEVMVIDLGRIESFPLQQQQERLVELGHAIGNQHWPAVVRDGKLYVPLTVDHKVAQSVMRSHNIEPLEVEFVHGREVLTYLSPHEVRRLFGGAEQSSATHHHSTDE